MKIKLFGWHMWLVYDTTTAGLVGAHSTNHGWSFMKLELMSLKFLPIMVKNFKKRQPFRPVRGQAEVN
jgi:hypothetical protein